MLALAHAAWEIWGGDTYIDDRVSSLHKHNLKMRAVGLPGRPTFRKCLTLADQIFGVGFSQWTRRYIHDTRVGFASMNFINSVYGYQRRSAKVDLSIEPVKNHTYYHNAMPHNPQDSPPVHVPLNVRGPNVDAIRCSTLDNAKV